MSERKPHEMPQQMQQMMALMQEDNGIAKTMMRPVYPLGESDEPVVSQAEVVADLFNISRLDINRMAEAVGVDIEIQRMQPEDAAMMMQGMIKGESMALIERFNLLEQKRESVLAEMLDREEYDNHRRVKFALSFTNPQFETPSDVPAEALEQDGESGGESEEDGGDDDAA